MKRRGKIIGIVGAPGSGKTTLGRNLKTAMACDFFEEDWESNPFVFGPKSIGAHGLEISIGFLLIRNKQYGDAQKLAESGRDVLMDTVFEMTDIYSKAFLDEVEYKLFHGVYEKFSEAIEQPDILIYLHAPYEILSGRAKSRQLGVELEKTQLSIDAIEAADKMIKQYVDTIDSKQVITIDVSTKDIRESNFVRELANKIENFSK